MQVMPLTAWMGLPMYIKYIHEWQASDRPNACQPNNVHEGVQTATLDLMPERHATSGWITFS